MSRRSPTWTRACGRSSATSPELVGRQEALRDQVRRDAASARQREPERPFTRERDLGIDLGR